MPGSCTNFFILVSFLQAKATALTLQAIPRINQIGRQRHTSALPTQATVEVNPTAPTCSKVSEIITSVMLSEKTFAQDVRMVICLLMSFYCVLRSVFYVKIKKII